MSVDQSAASDTWLDLNDGDLFGLQTLPFGSFSARHLPGPRVGVRVGDAVLDVTAASHLLGRRRADVRERNAGSVPRRRTRCVVAGSRCADRLVHRPVIPRHDRAADGVAR